MKTNKQFKMSIVHPNAAGIDIGSKFHAVAVSNDISQEPVRTFQSFTSDLHDMAKWLKSYGVTSIAMESTGVYWIPAFEILESYEFEVCLVNSREAKNVPGRKTDVNDANGFSAYISLDYCALVFARLRILQCYVLILGSVSACWSLRHLIFNTCKKH
jgi:hypothetical protein